MALISEGIVLSITWLTHLTGSHGIAIILFAFLLKALLLPVTFYGMRWQARFKTAMTNAKAEIERLDVSDKEARDDKIIEIYQAQGINLSNQGKALLPLLIQIPLLVAFYKTVVSWEVMMQSGFLWARDLSIPDAFLTLGFSLPWFGAYLNLLPFVLFAVNSSELLAFEGYKKAVKMLWLPALFFVLFYPFPASCMLFWITLNVAHIGERWYFLRYMSTASGVQSAVESDGLGTAAMNPAAAPKQE